MKEQVWGRGRVGGGRAAAATGREEECDLGAGRRESNDMDNYNKQPLHWGCSKRPKKDER